MNRVKKVATLANAREWYNLMDKYVFCIDLLDISINDDNADALVTHLEYNFEGLLDGIRAKAERELAGLTCKCPVLRAAESEGLLPEERLVVLAKENIRLLEKEHDRVLTQLHYK